MNQGNVGQHSGDNGVFHDGGLILKFPDRYLGLFLGFQTQRIPTDAAGNAAAGATPISQLLAGAPPPPPPQPPEVATSAIYIERALINPSGPDAGREVVVLANLATSAQTLTNWRLVDKNARVTAIDATIESGQSILLTLDGTGAQLGNQGGNLMLQDSHNAQVDVTTYTAEDASGENRYFRFRR
jgi:hypothetical protein